MNLINRNRIFVVAILLINDFIAFALIYFLSYIKFISFDYYNSINIIYFSYIILFFIFNIYSYKTSIVSSKLYVRIWFAFNIYFVILLSLLLSNIIESNIDFLIFIYFYLITYTIISRILFLEIFKFILSFNSSKKNCLIYGAGWAGIELTTQLSNFNIIGFIDDDNKKISQGKINNIKIYSKNNIQKIILEKNISIVFLAISNISYQQKKEIIDYLFQFNIECKVIPTLNELVNKNISLKDFKNINISDLIKRNYNFNHQDIKQELYNKIIIVTGAGGSIGSEIVNQILTFNPDKIIAIDNSEYNLYKLEQEIQSKTIKIKKNKILYKICDIRNLKQIEDIFNLHKPEYLFHTAAYKHVPILEDNIIEAITNNFLSVISLIDISITYNLKKFIYISSDKAVRPSNIMGASKRLSEIYIQSIGNIKKNQNIKTKFAIVRFGNVIGSTGSVLPLFNKQIQNGGPLTITHRDIERYFMTIPEAVGLLLETTILVKKTNIFVLDMGQPIKIIELAKKVINLSGLTIKDELNPNGDIEIKIIGLRPGEKLYEELFIDDKFLKTTHKNIYEANEDVANYEDISRISLELKKAIEEKNEKNIPRLIKNIVDAKY